VVARVAVVVVVAGFLAVVVVAGVVRGFGSMVSSCCWDLLLSCSLRGAFLTGTAGVEGFAAEGVTFLVAAGGDVSFFGVSVSFAVVLGRAFWVPIGVRVRFTAGLGLTALFVFGSGVFSAAPSPGALASGEGLWIFRMGSDFLVPIGVLVGTDFAGVAVFGLVAVAALLSFAGAFLTGVGLLVV